MQELLEKASNTIARLSNKLSDASAYAVGLEIEEFLKNMKKQKRYLLVIAGSSSFFESDSLEEINAMICLGDKFTVIDKFTGATKDNHYLKIHTNLF